MKHGRHCRNSGSVWLFALLCYLAGPPAAIATERCDPWVAQAASIQGKVERRFAGAQQWQTVQRADVFCEGDEVRVRDNSRAALILTNQTILRLDQNSTVTFTGLQPDQPAWLDLLQGVAHFISRVKQSFKVVTPFVNAFVEGTEFVVDVGAQATMITVFEGRVAARNAQGETVLSNGQAAVAAASQAPVLQTVVRPRDAVQWALHYPLIMDFDARRFAQLPAQWRQPLQRSLQAYQAGDLATALEQIDALPANQPELVQVNIYRASLRLRVGRVEDAGSDLVSAAAINSDDSDVLALLSIIAVVQNQSAQALELAQNAVAADAQNPAAALALSYAQQSGFDVEAALATLQVAVTSRPDDALLWARLSELYLSVGELERALDAAQQAEQRNPGLARTQSVLGFANLTQIRIPQAKAAFERAIELDQADPLARLGLGLALIRGGKLERGRGQIELAASLDPNNSLIRSYLGKAYFDEKRDRVAATELAMAKQLDPNDPTPWFYSAIRKQTVNRPVEALEDLQKSIKLNDRRFVYRSKLLLDDDLAARAVNQARIFQDLGFEKPALVKGWKSVTVAPDNFSAHRFLADSYSALPRHNVARASELLQSQLLAPINDTPLQPQLAEANLPILENSGPLAAAFNEYNPLFVSDGIRLQFNGLYGNNDTWGNDAVFSGIQKKLSYSFGQFHYETDGFRANNDNEEDLYNGFLQYAISPRFNVQGEFRRRETDQGDLRLNFDPDVFSVGERREVNQSTFRLGAHFEPTLSSDILVSYIYSDVNEKLAVPGFGVPSIDDEEAADARQLEAQFLYRQHSYNLVAGGGRYDVDYTGGSILDWTSAGFPFPCPPPLPPPTGQLPCSLPAQPDSRHDSVYLYSNISYPRNLTWTLGLGYDSVELFNDDNDRYSPKLGAQWDISSAIRTRLAYFETVKRSLVVQQSIEPTQVSGFNQFYDEPNGSRSDNYGAAFDARFSTALYTGLEYMHRDVDVQLINADSATTNYEKREEDTYRAYVNWALNKRWALTAEYRLEKIDNGNNPNVRRLDTASVPLGLNFFHANGIFAGVGVSYVDQEIKRQSSSQWDSDDFTLVDVSLGYRLPKRYGIIGVEVQNLFDENFSYQDRNFMTSELVPPEYIPDRTILGRLNLNF